MTDETLRPTPEQRRCIDLFAEGDDMVIEAVAAAGKTTVVRLMAESTPGRIGRYLAFNKGIAAEVAGKMPDTVTSSTWHSLAWPTHGQPFAHRLDAPRLRSWELARILRTRRLGLRVAGKTKVLGEEQMASLAMRSVWQFCLSADPEPGTQHVPLVPGIDMPDPAARVRTYPNNRIVAETLVPYMHRAWEDLTREDGDLPYRHDAYLKQFQLDRGRVAAEYVLADEAQDLNPVLIAIFETQADLQRIAVGDPAQQIYGWRGCEDALSQMREAGTAHASLSQSFRFGPPVADEANRWLDMLDPAGENLRVIGWDGITSTLGPTMGEPDVILCRTNAGAVEMVLDAQRRGLTAALVGGAAAVLSFAKAAEMLMDGRKTLHPELACFDSWAEVLEYVESDPQGGDLRLLVDLVEEYGTEVIIAALDKLPTPRRAQLLVSTTHVSKGLEWKVVRLHRDFSVADIADLPDEEIRLRYVAVTRARRHLDCSALYMPPPPPKPRARGGRRGSAPLLEDEAPTAAAPSLFELKEAERA